MAWHPNQPPKDFLNGQKTTIQMSSGFTISMATTLTMNSYLSGLRRVLGCRLNGHFMIVGHLQKFGDR